MTDHLQFILIVYDISNDRRRTKLHDRLCDFGTPVQYSVFECLLEDQEAARMKAAVKKIIRPRMDQVRMYYLCVECVRKTEISSGKQVLQPTEPGLVVGG